MSTKLETADKKDGEATSRSSPKAVTRVTDPLEKITLVSVDEVVPNWWNMSAGLSAEVDASLVSDMKEGGITAIDPIRVALLKNIKKDYDSKKDAVFVVLDGEQRLREAKRLKWSQIRAYVDNDLKDEAKARVVTFAKGNERAKGNDPFKEAENFKWHRDQGEILEDIAKRYHVDRSQVSHSLGLLNISAEVKKQVEGNTRFNKSHLEAVATLPPDAQKALVTQAVRGDYSVREIEEEAKRKRQAIAKAEELKEKIEKSKFPNCPTCKKPGNVEVWTFPEIGHTSEGGSSYGVGEEHRWNANTGKTYAQQLAEQRSESAKKAAADKKNAPPPVPQSFKTSHTVDEFVAAGLAHFKEIVAKLDSLEVGDYGDYWLEGKIGKDDVGLSIDTSTDGKFLFRLQEGKGEEFNLEVDTGSWKSEELKDMKASVTSIDGFDSEKELDKFQKQVIDWFEQYAPKASRKASKK